MDDDDYYRNARDHRPEGRRPPPPQQPQGGYAPPPQGGYAPPQQQGYYMQTQPQAPQGGYYVQTQGGYYVPAQPPTAVGINVPAIGRLLQAVAPLVASLLPLPTPPVPVPATSDVDTNVKAALTNQANAVTYQQAIAQAFKRDEAVFAVANGLGLLMEKGFAS